MKAVNDMPLRLFAELVIEAGKLASGLKSEVIQEKSVAELKAEIAQRFPQLSPLTVFTEKRFLQMLHAQKQSASHRSLGEDEVVVILELSVDCRDLAELTGPYGASNHTDLYERFGFNSPTAAYQILNPLVSIDDYPPKPLTLLKATFTAQGGKNAIIFNEPTRRVYTVIMGLDTCDAGSAWVHGGPVAHKTLTPSKRQIESKFKELLQKQEGLYAFDQAEALSVLAEFQEKSHFGHSHPKGGGIGAQAPILLEVELIGDVALEKTPMKFWETTWEGYKLDITMQCRVLKANYSPHQDENIEVVLVKNPGAQPRNNSNCVIC